MTDALRFALVFVSTLGCGLMAGLFFAFSVAVMRGLARLAPAGGIAAMQAINAAILNPWFAAAFFGTAAACVLVLISALWRWHQPGAVYLLVGSVLYLVGVFLVTVMFNVPLNQALAAAATSTPDGTSLWTDYLSRWTAWNHVRAIAALAAAAALTLALCRTAAPPV